MNRNKWISLWSIFVVGALLLALATLFGGRATHASGTPPSGLVSWWRAEGDANDSWGNNDGILINGATFAPGMSGQAFSLATYSSAYISIPHDPSLSFGGNSSMSFALWLNGATMEPYSHILGKRSGCANSGITYQSYVAPNRSMGWGGETGGLDAVTAPGPGVWTFLAGTYDGATGTYRIYVNGVLEGTTVPGQSLGPPNTAELRIGGSGDCATFSGLIDEVQIYNRTLSDAEIYDIYLAASDTPTPTPAPPPTACVPLPSGLVSWWPGDGNANDVWDGHPGVLQGGVTFVPGLMGQAFNLDGVNDSVDLGNWFNLQSFTIAMWARAGATQVTYADIVDNNHSNYRGWVAQQLGPGHPPNAYGYGSADGGGGILFNLTPDTWQYLVFTRDEVSRENKVYLDGILMGTTIGSGPVVYDGTQFMRLGRWGGGGRNWNGQLDDVQVYNRALSNSEITAFYHCIVNQPPAANAGSDQTVDQDTLVTLDGSGSSDPDGDPLTYQWLQIGGPLVSLDLTDPVHPSFVAPDVPIGGATLTFQLTVSDGIITSDPAVVNITVKNVNHPPVADAGSDQTAGEGAMVTLDGSGSYDSDNDALGYSWVQTAGPTVVLYDSNMAQPSFTAPQVDPIGATLEFELTVSDGLATVTDSVTVLVNNNNVTPTADAGADQTVDEGTPATLDGSASSDPDDDPLTYIWSQTSGPLVNLSDANSAMPSFTAPVVGPGGATLAFQLTVNDGIVDSAPDEVTIYVLDTNDPPMCSAAQPSMAILWPPNHKLVAVQILGVTDPDNDGVTIIVTGVTQDEPIIGLGDGDTGPDAVITSDGILLRAERSGTGDGRVYVIAFTASDIDGGSCSGIVTVGVPHDRAGTPVDSGQNYDSLQS